MLWPIAGLLVLAWAVRPTDRNPTIAPLRLAIVRAALILGTVAVVSVETLSIFHALNTAGIVGIWALTTIGIVLAATARYRHDTEPLASRTWRRVTATAAAATTGQWATAGIIAIIGLSVALLVVIGHPNNFDSQTYHLPRIEHWVQNGTVDPFATRIHRQIDIAPGAEYLLTHLRLISGGDSAYLGLQFLAGAGCLAAASRLTAQLGGNHLAQLATVFFLATTPEVILQASSTQVDLVTAAWVASVATIALNDPLPRLAARSHESQLDVVYLGMAVGLTALTKTSGLIAAGVFCLWWLLRRLHRHHDHAPPCLCRRDNECTRSTERRGATAIRTLAASGAVVLIAFTIVGPFLGRMQSTFGNPLGPDVLTSSIGTGAHDPRLLSVNLLKIAHTALDTPLPPLSDLGSQGVEGYADAIGVDVNDPAITFPGTAFPVDAWYPDQDRAAFPITGYAALAGFVYCLVRARARSRPRPAPSRTVYALAIALIVLGFAATVAWQPWINRLLLFIVVLAAPMAGLLAAALVEKAAALSSTLRRLRGQRGGQRHRVRLHTVAVWGVVATVSGLAALAGILTTTYGYPHRLAGSGSVLTVSETEERFLRRAAWQAPYESTAEAVAVYLNTDAPTAHVGLVQSNDSWEYPWWFLLREELDDPDRLRLHALQSDIPDHSPAAAEDMDAIVCAEDLVTCRDLVPPGWDWKRHGIVAYALPGSDEDDGETSSG